VHSDTLYVKNRKKKRGKKNKTAIVKNPRVKKKCKKTKKKENCYRKTKPKMKKKCNRKKNEKKNCKKNEKNKHVEETLQPNKNRARERL